MVNPEAPQGQEPAGKAFLGFLGGSHRGCHREGFDL